MSYIKDAVNEFLTRSEGCSPKVVAGFDGFVDTLVRPIQKKLDDGAEYFNDMEVFSEHIKARAGKSCSVGIDTTVRKLGGNAPIFSSTLAKLGANVDLIGAVGYPVPDKLFADMENVTLHSIANPGETTALEFNDGKIMLVNANSLNEITWERVKELIGVDKLMEMYSDAGIIGMFNWSDMINSTDIWRGLANEVLPNVRGISDAVVSVDLCDTARRKSEDICEVIDVLRDVSKHCKVILNLNYNEYRQVFNALTDSDAPEKIEESDMLSVTGLDVVCVHFHNGSTAFDKSGAATVETYFIKNPKISTGGGDNFNAGFTLAVYYGLSLRDSLVIANAVSGFYIKNGHSAARNDLISHAEEWERAVLR